MFCKFPGISAIKKLLMTLLTYYDYPKNVVLIFYLDIVSLLPFVRTKNMNSDLFMTLVYFYVTTRLLSEDQ